MTTAPEFTASPYTSRRRILVVDDQADAAATLALLLRLHGHEVEVARDGSTALEVLKSREVDVVFIDIDLPDINGLEVARRIRESGRKALLVALTGYCEQDDLQRSSEAGFDHHLTKPVTISIIKKILS